MRGAHGSKGRGRARGCGWRGTLAAFLLVCGVLISSPVWGQAWAVSALVAQTAAMDAAQSISLPGTKTLEQARVADLRMLLSVYRRIAAVANATAELDLVATPVVNAFAIPRPERIVVTTGMLRVIDGDEGMMAAVIGHELAHIARRHAVKAAHRAGQHARAGIAAGREITLESRSATRGSRAAQLIFLALNAAFSREQEAEADRVGTELMAQAKFDPDGTLRLFRRMIDRFGSRPTGYLGTHPGLEERIARAEPAVMDEHFRLLAERLHAAGEWLRLLHVTDTWLHANEHAAWAWHYRGAALRSLGRSGALPAYERAVAIDPSLAGARLALCIELYAAGRVRESLACAEHLQHNGDREAYAMRTFGHPVHVHGLTPTPSPAQERIRIVPN